MKKEVLRSIEGVGIYPVVSFVIFGLIFLGALVYVIKMNKKHVSKMKDLPLN